MTAATGAGRLAKEKTMTDERFIEILGDVMEWRGEIALLAEDAEDAVAQAKSPRAEAAAEARLVVLGGADDDLACAESCERAADLIANLQMAAGALGGLHGAKRIAREIRDALANAGVAP